MTTPGSGEIAADGALPVNVTFDTTGITQPGDYYGQLQDRKQQYC